MYSVGVGDVLEHVGQVVGKDHSVPVEERAVTGLTYPGGVRKRHNKSQIMWNH